jgi:pyrroline-5-carboxylate reductase
MLLGGMTVGNKAMNQKQKKLNIGILGYGNMGKAIFKLLQQQPEVKKAVNFYICSLNTKNVQGAACLKNAEELCHKADIIFLCIKPQNFHQLPPQPPLSGGRRRFPPDRGGKGGLIIISIMAGVTIAQIEKTFPKSRVIRTMPNLPLQVGQGVIGWHARQGQFAAIELKFIEKLFSYFGQSIYVKTEKMLDVITAVSGSGPAYVFLFINSLIKAARKLGLNKKEAREIVLQTVSGSLTYLKNQNNNLEQLIKKVTSKKGTTAAALAELNIKAFEKQWQKAIAKAYKRAKELSA